MALFACTASLLYLYLYLQFDTSSSTSSLSYIPHHTYTLSGEDFLTSCPYHPPMDWDKCPLYGVDCKHCRKENLLAATALLSTMFVTFCIHILYHMPGMGIAPPPPPPSCTLLPCLAFICVLLSPIYRRQTERKRRRNMAWHLQACRQKTGQAAFSHWEAGLPHAAL